MPKPGPKPSITLEVVKRVSERFALGVPLQHALATENNPKVNLPNWQKTLQRYPELSSHYEAARGQFLETAMRRLEADDNLANLRWLLERRYSDLFAAPAPVNVNVAQQTVINGMPDDILARARQIAVGKTGTNGDHHNGNGNGHDRS